MDWTTGKVDWISFAHIIISIVYYIYHNVLPLNFLHPYTYTTVIHTGKSHKPYIALFSKRLTAGNMLENKLVDSLNSFYAMRYPKHLGID